MNIKKLIKLSTILPIMAFSFDVEFNKNFTVELPHNTLGAYLKVAITDDSEASVSQRLEEFNKEIKGNKKVQKSLGTFTVRPEYRHSSNTPKITGYVGELRYKIDSQDASDINEFISKVIELKNNRDTTVSVNNLKWSLKDSTYKAVLEDLRLKAIIWGQNYAKTLSKEINKDCNIKNIDFTKMQQYTRNANVMYATSSAITKSVPVPEANLEKIEINPKYILECE